MKTVDDASLQSGMIDISQHNPMVVCSAAEWGHPNQSAVTSPEQMESSYAGRATLVTMNLNEDQHIVDRYGVLVMSGFMVSANSQSHDG